MEVLSNIPGLPGVFLACIFSCSLSTISSSLNSLAAVIIADVYKGLFRGQLNDEQEGFISKIFSIVLGIVVMQLTYVVSHMEPILNSSTLLFGALQGPIMDVFFIGFFFPRANRLGGLISFISGVALPLWIFDTQSITII